ncbi:uncharacterized protein LOC108459080 [Gossypium arboreum]|uniref:uncharacterized protein LOC108459080 n=1 Tax=Gossypium arboreum TaxID=29729 RepID=UPI00081903DA|nr:uncharacterized protein LOC108459080 [Gossypium arboreum]
MGKIENVLNLRPQGALPNDTENSRSQGKELCKAITLRSRTQLDDIAQDATTREDNSNNNHLHINIPVVDALEKMPNYVKFMKDILSKNLILGELEIVTLTKGCTTMLTNKLPPKLKNPRSFTIPSSIGNHYVSKALYDLRASINLMPMSIFKKLGIGKSRPTAVTLQLVDRSYVHPDGKIENVLVRVDQFIFPRDFLILECEVDQDVSIIIGRPFLATGRMLIDA